MGLDGFTLRALVSELGPALADARLTKIHQPARDEIALVMYHQRRDVRLVLSANPRWARLGVEVEGLDNPQSPPPFCMVLRKHLDGARLLSITQEGLERIVTLTFSVRDELGDLRQKRLLLEIMGRHSNLLLVDEQDIILDAIRRVSDEEAMRPLVPGVKYLPPPRPEVPDALTVDGAKMAQAVKGDSPVADALVDRLFGLSPLMAREVCARAGIPHRTLGAVLNPDEVNAIHAALISLRASDTALDPQLVVTPQGRREFSAFDLTQFPDAPRERFSDVNALIAAVLGREERREALGAVRRSLSSVVRREIERCERKRSLQLEEARAGREADDLRIAGELVLANLSRLQKRMSTAMLQDYEGNERTVTLNPSLTPSENAQAYFRRYARAKKAAVAAAEHARQTGEELAYLEQVSVAIDQAGDAAALAEIRLELGDQGYIRASASPQKGNAKRTVSAPREFVSADGRAIIVGRNNLQNDLVTMKLARPADIWLHVKDMPGSHVILRAGDGPLPDAAIEQAASLAAYYSSARESSKVPVDYTERRHVRKVPGARPGMVIYDHQKTILAVPKAPPETSGR